eukprot:6212404-Pleurochrysis_carterae.AAC.1
MRHIGVEGRGAKTAAEVARFALAGAATVDRPNEAVVSSDRGAPMAPWLRLSVLRGATAV